MWVTGPARLDEVDAAEGVDAHDLVLEREHRADEAALGGGVVRVAALAEAAGGRAGEDERRAVPVVARAVLGEAAQERARGVQGAQEVDRHGVGEPFGRELGEGHVAGGPDARVRRAHVDAPEGAGHLVRAALHRRRVAHVALDHEGALGPELGGDPLPGRVRVAVGVQRHPRALGAEELGDRAADPARRAGHPDGELREAEVHQAK